jgi:hypothetical protein
MLEQELYEQYIDQGLDDLSADIMASEIAGDLGFGASDGYGPAER